MWLLDANMDVHLGVVVNNANGGKVTSTHIFPAAGSPRTGQPAIRWSF